MNKKQLVDYKIWKQNPEQPLPESLENVFIEDCLNYKKAKYPEKYFNLDNDEKTILILHFLSRTSDGQTLISFLDIPLKADFIYNNVNFYLGDIINYTCTHKDNYERVYENVEEKICLIKINQKIGFLRIESNIFWELKTECFWELNEFEKRFSWKWTEVENYTLDTRVQPIPTLRKKLKDQFLDALTEEGKSLKQALETINKTYLLHFYE